MIIGLVGRSCSGKNVAAKYFEERGLPAIDVDKLGHQALVANRDLLAKTFGEEILNEEGRVDRKVLGKIVFSDKEKLETLNGISHPWMRRQVIEFTQAHETCFINCALLESMDLVKYCHEILYFWAPLQIRLERAVKRDKLTGEGFLLREENQKQIGASLFDSGKRVFTILNDRDLSYLYRQLEAYYIRLEGRGYIYG